MDEKRYVSGESDENREYTPQSFHELIEGYKHLRETGQSLSHDTLESIIKNPYIISASIQGDILTLLAQEGNVSSRFSLRIEGERGSVKGKNILCYTITPEGNLKIYSYDGTSSVILIRIEEEMKLCRASLESKGAKYVSNHEKAIQYMTEQGIRKILKG